MNAIAALLLFVCQDPVCQDPVAAATAPLDVVALKNGDELQGRITAEVDGYVELQLEAGATVGLSTANIAAIRRGAGAARSEVAELRPRSEWFVLHDANGAAVGWLATAITARADGGFTVSEEYEFMQGKRRFQVTTMASADAGRTPTSCYFRERISTPVFGPLRLEAADSGQQERVLEERIVEATCGDGRLRVQRLDPHGRSERDVSWPATATFPLLARTLARQAGAPLGPVELFDPAVEEMVVRSYDGTRRRRVSLDGVTQQVFEVAESSPVGRNAEWLDATMRTLRRELAGPALVALPSNADSVRFAVGATTIPGAVAAEPAGTFGLWVPNPAWVRREPAVAGQVALGCPVHGANVLLAQLDHLEVGCTLDAAGNAVANWFSLLHPELRIDSRDEVTRRDRRCLQLHASGRRGAVPWQATVDVIPLRERFLVLVCTAPKPAWDELAPDFAFLQRSVELDPQALSPQLQGPLAREQGKNGNNEPKRSEGQKRDAARDTARATAPSSDTPAVGVQQAAGAGTGGTGASAGTDAAAEARPAAPSRPVIVRIPD